jgi:CO dehydrogenase maturation factor
MKIAITGKGGVGKTTIATLMAGILSDSGNKVMVIDADPDMNVAALLGIPKEKSVTPIIELKDLIAERTGTKVGEPAPFFTMNPKVDDIPEKYCLEQRGIKLLVMGTVKKGGGGCACPENAFLKTLLSHLMVARKEWVILDMEAGIEHIGRGTAIGVDEMLVVVEPSRMSIDTAYRIEKLSKDIGIKSIRIIGNKIRSPEEKKFIEENTEGLEILGFIDSSEEIQKINTNKISALDIAGKPIAQINELLKRLALYSK